MGPSQDHPNLDHLQDIIMDSWFYWGLTPQQQPGSYWGSYYDGEDEIVDQFLDEYHTEFLF